MSSMVILNSLILLLLSIIHFYWAFGGNWRIESTVPDKFQNQFFNPKNRLRNAILTITVGFGLAILAVIIASNHFDLSSIINENWSIIGARIIGVVFILRAIGDFNIMGLFKKPSKSKFAKSDAKIFVPLCLYLGISSILITLF